MDGVLAGVVELLGVKCLSRGESRAAPTNSSAGSGGGEAVAGVGGDEFALQFGQHGEHAEHGAAFGGGGVDALLEDFEADAAFSQCRAEGDQVQYGPAEAVQAGDDKGVIVVVAQVPQDLVELGSAGFGSGGVIEVDVFFGDAGAAECIGLVAGILLGGGDPGVISAY